MALLVLGEIHRLEELLDQASDETGLLLDRKALPKRIDKQRRKRKGAIGAGTGSKGNAKTHGRPYDDEGGGFCCPKRLLSSARRRFASDASGSSTRDAGRVPTSPTTTLGSRTLSDYGQRTGERSVGTRRGRTL